MNKKLEFKDKDQRRKCWLLTVFLTVVSMFIFFFTWLFCEVNPDFFSVSIIFLIVFWQWYIINKFFIASEFSNKIKIKSALCSLLSLLLLSLIFVILGEKSYPYYFDVPAKIVTFAVVPFMFLIPVTKSFITYLKMDSVEKKLTFLYWFYAAVFSSIVGFSLNFAFTRFEFTIISPLIIEILCILYFLSLLHTFSKFTLFNKKKQVKRFGINLLILLIFIGLSWGLYIWIVNMF